MMPTPVSDRRLGLDLDDLRADGSPFRPSAAASVRPPMPPPTIKTDLMRDVVPT